MSEQATIILPKTLVLTSDWQQALELFLGSRRSEATRRAYAAALQDLLTTSGRLPWEVSRTDVVRWVGAMKSRNLSAATISTRLAGVSSFYEFVSSEYMVTGAEGSQAPLHGANPAAGKTLRPKVELYGRAVWLSAEESRALLRAIKPTGALLDARALRNYALFLGYIFLARRNSEWRVARFGDFHQVNGKIEYRWSGKGRTDQRIEVPAPVWAAVKEYLQAAGRAGIGMEEYIFTPLQAHQLRGRKVGTAGPLSAHEVGRLLKRYCRLAGLDARQIHVHTLRHTGAMLRREVGDSPEEIQKFLVHANLAMTAVYLHALKGREDRSWGLVADLLGLEETLYNGQKKAKKGSKINR